MHAWNAYEPFRSDELAIIISSRRRNRPCDDDVCRRVMVMLNLVACLFLRSKKGIVGRERDRPFLRSNTDSSPRSQASFFILISLTNSTWGWITRIHDYEESSEACYCMWRREGGEGTDGLYAVLPNSRICDPETFSRVACCVVLPSIESVELTTQIDSKPK
jgi:hypothetical protein